MASTAAREYLTELAELTSVPAPGGSEEPVAEWIAFRLRDLAVVPRIDALGNLLLVPARRPRILVVAHMDQVGYMVSRLGDDGAHCLPLGEPRIPPARAVPVRVLRDEHPPLPAELTSLGDGGGVVRSDRLEDVRVGDRVVFASALEGLDGDRMCGPALDNRIGCLLALQAARELAAETSDVAFAWTVREESEQSGVIRAVRELDPELVVAVDITYATSGEEGMDSVVSVGGGPAITLLDGGMVGHKALVRSFGNAAGSIGLGWQREVVRSGVSEAGRVQKTLGIPALALLVPIENPHSDRETASVEDVAAAMDLLMAGLREVSGGSAAALSSDDAAYRA